MKPKLWHRFLQVDGLQINIRRSLILRTFRLSKIIKMTIRLKSWKTGIRKHQQTPVTSIYRKDSEMWERNKDSKHIWIWFVMNHCNMMRKQSWHSYQYPRIGSQAEHYDILCRHLSPSIKHWNIILERIEHAAYCTYIPLIFSNMEV